jgi:hypothetical protein
MFWAIVEVAIWIGIGAEVVRAVCESGIERERNRQRLIQRRRKILKKETEYKARGKILDYLRQISKEEIEHRNKIKEEINKLKKTRQMIRNYLSGPAKSLSSDTRKKIRQSLIEVEESINTYWGEYYRISLFLDEVSYWRHEIKKKSLYFRIADKVPALSLSNFFVGEDFPIRRHIVHASIRSPKTGPEFLLDSGIRGELPIWEERPKKYKWGEKVKVFIEWINYKERKAIVSLKRAELLCLKEERLSSKTFNANVVRVFEQGCDVTIGGVKCFLPRSKEANYHIRLTEGQQVKVKILNRNLKTGNIVVTAHF